jgi:hypothetical protein
MPRSPSKAVTPEKAGASSSKQPRNTKRTGELSEAAFLHKAVGLGLKVIKPWGDSERYDFVVDSGQRMWRVQIKCTAVVRAGGYHIQPIHFVYGKNKVVYTGDEIDVLAAHIVPVDAWYLVPVSVLTAGTSLRLYPEGGCKRPRFEEYREAWDVFRGEPLTTTAYAESDSGEAEDEIIRGAPIGDPENVLIQIRRPVWKPWIFRNIIK